jgi:hypothetical protein
MNTRAEPISSLSSHGEDSAKSDTWCRVMSLVKTPYLPVAALGFVAVAASAVWLVVGGSWWFPVCLAVSAVSMIGVWWSVYKCWIQRKAIHQSFCPKKESSKESRT